MDLAAQLPGALGAAVEAGNSTVAESFGVEEFCHRVNSQRGTGASTAGWDASAVLSTVAEAISGGELNQLLSVLPSGYAALFGKPELGQ